MLADEDKRDNYRNRDNENAENNDNFIMLPTVDFCFKELMKNPKVRKGFVAAILGKSPETVRRTTVIDTELRKESEDDKLGILDVLVELEDGGRMNMEMQVPYFEYWANRVLFYVSKIYTGQIKKVTITRNCRSASMSVSLISSISRRIRGATGRSRSVTWRQENSIQT